MQEGFGTELPVAIGYIGQIKVPYYLVGRTYDRGGLKGYYLLNALTPVTFNSAEKCMLC